MIVIALTDNTIDALLDSIRSIKHDVDVIELRLDFLKHVDLKKLAHLLSQVNYPVIFTLRPLEQGGHYQGDESSRIDLIGQLVKLKPAYFDLSIL